MEFSLEIITPKGIYLEGKATSLTIKLTSGYRTFLAGHAPLIGCLDYAPAHIVRNGKTDFYAVHGGAINVTKDKIIVICNAIEHAKDIDVARAKESKKRAEERLAKKDPNINLKRARLALARALARLKAAESK